MINHLIAKEKVSAALQICVNFFMQWGLSLML